MTPVQAAQVAAPVLTAAFAGLMWWLTAVTRRPGFPGNPVLLTALMLWCAAAGALAWAWAGPWAGLLAGTVFLTAVVAWGRRAARGQGC